MTDAISGCFIVPRALSLLRDGPGAPLWRAVATLENAVLLNVVSAAIIVLCLSFVVKRFCFWRESFEVPPTDGKEVPLPHSRLAPYFAMVAFLVVPQFADQVMALSPLLPGLVPGLLAAALLASLNTHRPAPCEEDDDPEDDDRHLVNLRLFISGALASVGVWEGSFGLCLAPLLLAATWLSFIRRTLSVTVASAVWTLGFVTAFILEPLVLTDCPWTALTPQRVPFAGLLALFFLSVMPLAVVRKFGERRWVMSVWGLAIAGMAVNTLVTVSFERQSASERFARRVVGDLGERKLILGDGRFDVMIDEYKPSDVKRIGKASVAEKEFLLRLVDKDAPVTNKVLVVRDYHDYDDPGFIAALAETGIVYRKPDDRKGAEEKRRKARAQSLRQRADSLLESLHAMNEGYDDLPESLRELETSKAQTNIRQGWKDGFAGTRLSTTLLSIDMRRANRATLEADAVNALIVDRNDPAANSIMGQLRLEDGKLDDAEHYLRKGAKGGGALATSRLAMLLVNTGRAKEAEDWARKGVALVPRDWNLRQPLVAALVENGKSEEAQRELETMLDDADKVDALEQAKAFADGVRKRIRQLKRHAER